MAFKVVFCDLCAGTSKALGCFVQSVWIDEIKSYH